MYCQIGRLMTIVDELHLLNKSEIMILNSDLLMFLSLFLGSLIRGASFRLLRLFRTVRTFRVLKQFRLIEKLTTRLVTFHAYIADTHQRFHLLRASVIIFTLFQGWFCGTSHSPRAFCSWSVDWYICNGWHAAVSL